MFQVIITKWSVEQLKPDREKPDHGKRPKKKQFAGRPLLEGSSEKWNVKLQSDAQNDGGYYNSNYSCWLRATNAVWVLFRKPITNSTTLRQRGYKFLGRGRKIT